MRTAFAGYDCAKAVLQADSTTTINVPTPVICRDIIACLALRINGSCFSGYRLSTVRCPLLKRRRSGRGTGNDFASPFIPRSAKPVLDARQSAVNTIFPLRSAGRRRPLQPRIRLSETARQRVHYRGRSGR